MNKRMIWSILFSVVYLAPFLFGGWYIILGGLLDDFWGVENSISTNIVTFLIITGYGILYSFFLSLIAKLNKKKMMINTGIAVASFSLLIILVG